MGPTRSSEEKRELWRGYVEDWAGSGLSQREFCQGRGIKLGSFQWWRWWLKQLAKGQERISAGRRSAGVEQGQRANQSLFVPVRVVESTPGRRTWGEGAGVAGRLELVLRASGHRVIIRGEFDEKVLARLIAVAERVSG